ncbi:hypothetical protein [Pseudomonas orientalis]|uniref:hypothetical protein n=1 Tax=Pseudomonas orientalis TaxID=76758 RepID=UPI0013DD9D02|nr:hypothetical protein [Pseudomonas orientalis]
MNVATFACMALIICCSDQRSLVSNREVSASAAVMEGMVMVRARGVSAWRCGLSGAGQRLSKGRLGSFTRRGTYVFGVKSTGSGIVTYISDHSRRNWLFFVLYSAPAIFHLNTGHRHANSQAVI